MHRGKVLHLTHEEHISGKYEHLVLQADVVIIGDKIYKSRYSEPAPITSEHIFRDYLLRDKSPVQPPAPRVSRLTVARLFNTGSYQHVRYEVSVDVPEGASPATALIGLERILECLNPNTRTHTQEHIYRETRHYTEMLKHAEEMTEENFRRQYGHFEGSPVDYVARCKAQLDTIVGERGEWERRQNKARKLLEDLGGAANWRDAKLDWEGEHDEP